MQERNSERLNPNEIQQIFEEQQEEQNMREYGGVNEEEMKKQPEKEPPKKQKKNTANREFAVITYSFLALFCCLIGYFSYFQFVKSEEFVNSPYNTRQESLAKKVVRGQIRSADGEILAETIGDEGEDVPETRVYPYGSIFSHVVGYSTKGKSGIESLANAQLIHTSEDLVNKVSSDVQGTKSKGDSVITTLNYPMQALAHEALGYYKGAVVVLEPATGKILAMVSKPDFDPNTIAREWEELTAEDNTDAALLNRATHGLYPPGSTFKIFTTLEYIRENPDYKDYRYTCNGSYTVGDHTIHCYGNKAHGTQDFKQAFANSCNAFYASLGLEVDKTKFRGLCDDMLFNTPLPTEIPASKSSFVLSETDGSSISMATAIGQGKTLVTPLHMAMTAGAIANNGVLMKPYVIERSEDADGNVVEQYKPEKYGRLMTEEEAAVMQEYMAHVVEAGTGRKLSGQSYQAAGKTGSAEYSTGADSSHSWFVGYAHQDMKEDIAIAVIVERAGVGSEYAVPIAKEIFDAYYKE